MRVMVIVKATKDSEAGRLPSAELMAAMGAFRPAKSASSSSVSLVTMVLSMSAISRRLRRPAAGWDDIHIASI